MRVPPAQPRTGRLFSAAKLAQDEQPRRLFHIIYMLVHTGCCAVDNLGLFLDLRIICTSASADPLAGIAAKTACA